MIKLAVVAFIIFALSACGSDSSDDSSTPAPDRRQHLSCLATYAI